MSTVTGVWVGSLVLAIVATRSLTAGPVLSRLSTNGGAVWRLP
jgi:hypothetical protein